MKSIKYIVFGLMVTLSTFFVVLYSSCSKDECGAVTCLNKGTCFGGRCQCTPGIYGSYCETIYSETYKGAYKGFSPYDVPNDTINSLIFIASDDTTNFNKMEVLWIDSSMFNVLTLPILLRDHTTSGSAFDVEPTPKGRYIYTGSGSIDAHRASMRLIEQDTAGPMRYLEFANYVR